ncbi:MAG: hypothetical protein HOO06_13495 [Bdellovibrionaceae bacterium]|nr:hypothetical protein [Pseudobdellovibrionaceae bacterium]
MIEARMLHSRIQRLKKSNNILNVFIKREDELSFGISGTKIRKYKSLIPELKRKKINKILVIAGKNSNNLLAAAQLLTEAGFDAHFLIFGTKEWPSYYSSFDFFKLLIPADKIFWQSSEDWPQVEPISHSINKENLKNEAYILHEGAFSEHSLPGAMELYDSVLANQEEHQLKFDHIFMDSGSGLGASAFLIQYFLAGKINAHIHITQMAGGEEELFKAYEKCCSWAQNKKMLYGSEDINNFRQLPDLRTQEKVSVYKPSLAPSFGSVNSSVLKFVKQFAQEEGVILDPLYNAKAFHKASEVIEKNSLKGNTLLIHSGGALGLVGYLDQLRKLD